MSDQIAIFAIIPIEILMDHKLTLIETRVIASILSFRNKNTNVSFPSREKIAERCGYSEGTVSNATKSLVEKGWLKKTKKVFNGPNTYEVIVPDEPHRSGDTHGISDNRRTGEHEPHRSGEHIPHRSGEPNRLITDHRTDQPKTCPHQEIIDVWHELMPELPKVQRWTGKRESSLRARWNESKKVQCVDWWRGLFTYIRQSDFLMGNVPGRNGKPPFQLKLSWLVLPENFAKVLEGDYHS